MDSAFVQAREAKQGQSMDGRPGSISAGKGQSTISKELDVLGGKQRATSAWNGPLSVCPQQSCRLLPLTLAVLLAPHPAAFKKY